MAKINFQCETITPMFCYGADQNTPEIRAASIKGGLRFWWRALNGHLVENNDYSKLRKKETEIFGGSGFTYKGKNGDKIEVPAQRSKVVIRVKNGPNYNELVESFEIPENSFYKIEYNKIKYSPVPHKPEGKNFPQPCIPCGTNFDVELKLVKDIKFEKERNFNLESLKSLFIIYSILGGIGKRSRRGFGSFKIVNYQINDKEIEEFEYSENVLQENFKQIIADRLNTNEGKIEISSNRDKNYPYLRNVQLGKTANYNTLLSDIGKESSKNSYSDYTGFAKGNNRLSSPLYVSIYPINNELAIVFSELNCSFNSGWNPQGKINAINNFRQNLQEEKNEK